MFAINYFKPALFTGTVVPRTSQASDFDPEFTTCARCVKYVCDRQHAITAVSGRILRGNIQN